MPHRSRMSRVTSVIKKFGCIHPHNKIYLYLLWLQNQLSHQKSLMTFMTNDLHDRGIFLYEQMCYTSFHF